MNRKIAFVIGVASSLAFSPAEAAWRGFVNREVGVSFKPPGDMKAEKTTYRMGNAPALAATVFRTLEDNIEYRLTVVELGSMSQDEAIKTATAQLQAGGRKVLFEEEARVDGNYGRKMSLDLPNNGGRSVGSVFFKNGHLIQLDATVLPANGDYGSPDTTRFADSVAFLDSRVEENIVELKLQK